VGGCDWAWGERWGEEETAMEEAAVVAEDIVVVVVDGGFIEDRSVLPEKFHSPSLLTLDPRPFLAEEVLRSDEEFEWPEIRVTPP